MPFEPYPTGGAQLKTLFQYVESFGFLDFILPALLIFTVVFAILQMVPFFQKKKMKKEGDALVEEKYPDNYPVESLRGKTIMVGNRQINSIIAIVISLMIAVPHAAGIYPPNLDPIVMISKILPSAVVVLAAMFLVMLMLGFAGAGDKSLMQLVIAAIGVGLLVFIFATNIFPDFFPYFDFLKDPSIQALLIVLLTMGLVGYWVIRPEGPAIETRVKEWMLTKHPPARP